MVQFPSGFVWTARNGFIVCVRAPLAWCSPALFSSLWELGLYFLLSLKNTTTILKSEAFEKMSKASEKKDCSENSQCSGVPRLEYHRRVDKGQLNKIGRNDHTRFPHIACVYSYFLGSFSVANQSASSISTPSIAFSTTTQRLQDWPQRFHIHCRLFPFSL